VGGERGREKGERRSVRIHKRLLYCVNLNRTSLDHLLLGKCADVDSARNMEQSLSHGKDYNAAIIVGKSGQTYLHTRLTLGGSLISKFPLATNPLTAGKRAGYGWRMTAGGFHRPLSASFFGQYIRRRRLNPPSGAGSQLRSLLPPGASCWM
jgi:hypothetical protein